MALEDTVGTITTFTILSLWRQFTVNSSWMYKVNNISFYINSAVSSYKCWIFLAENCKCPIRFVTMDIYYNKQTISWSYFLILIFPFNALSISTQIMLFLGIRLHELLQIVEQNNNESDWMTLIFFCISSGKIKQL